MSTGIASAGPFCYETGPGFEKCISSPHGDYFNPVYQGPKLPDGSIPWVPDPDPLPPIFIPPLPPAAVTIPNVTGFLEHLVQDDMQAFFDNPANDKAQYALHFGHVSLARTGDTTYEGTVAVSTGGGPERDIPVHVTADDRNVAWNLDPGALIPLFQYR
jgi:hypothetical protein